MPHASRRAVVASLACLITAAFATPSFAAGNDDVVKPLKTVVGSVRYGKDLAALKQFAGEEQGKFLLGDDWAKGTPAQQKEFVELFQTLFAKIAFPRIRENFKHLETVLYDAPKVEGDSATTNSTIVILHALKKQELKVKYRLARSAGSWKVVDATVLGASMLGDIKTEQIVPIMKEGGWEHLLKLMREKAKEVEGVKLK